MIDDLLVSIVLYKQQLQTTPSFISITAALEGLQPCTLLVYDNSPMAQNVPDRLNNWQITYIHNPNNEGISKAYNTAANVAEQRGKKWLLFIDQDTVFPAEFLRVLIDRVSANPNIEIFSPLLKNGDIIVSPAKVYWEKGRPLKNVEFGKQSLQHRLIINSGLCVSLDAFKAAGGYNDKIKLDFSDHYFVTRLKQHHKYFYLLETQVEHSLSTFSDNDEARISRFKFYCNGARHYSTFKTFLPLFVICTLRTLKLSLQSKNPSFVYTYFKYYILPSPL